MLKIVASQAALDILWMSYGYDSGYPMNMTVDIHKISPADLFVLILMDIRWTSIWIFYGSIFNL